ncbi:MAG: hypothetical protein J6A21_06325 [Lentisphaeria bacterium]|nr:hypothetical protein [Lentisphaeria bacterium]
MAGEVTQAVVGAVGCLVFAAAVTVVAFIGYWVVNIVLYLLPVVVGVGILLGIVYAIGYVIFALLTGR